MEPFDAEEVKQLTGPMAKVLLTNIHGSTLFEGVLCYRENHKAIVYITDEDC